MIQQALSQRSSAWATTLSRRDIKMATVQYLYAGSGAPIAERRAGTTSFYQLDGLKSTRQLVDSNGDTTDTFHYDTLGNELSHAGSNPTPFTWKMKQGMYRTASGMFVQDASRTPSDASSGFWDSEGGLGLSIDDTIFGLGIIDIIIGIGSGGGSTIIYNEDGDAIIVGWPFIIVVGPPTPSPIGSPPFPGPSGGPPAPLPGGWPMPGGLPTPGGTKGDRGCKEAESPCYDGGTAVGACIALFCSLYNSYQFVTGIKDASSITHVDLKDWVNDFDGSDFKDWLKWAKGVLGLDDPFSSTEDCCKKAKSQFDTEGIPTLFNEICKWMRGQDIAAGECAELAKDHSSCDSCCDVQFENETGPRDLCKNICLHRYGGDPR
jgi:hypothetical protein